MISINSTPNYAGVKIIGDYYDFDQLYDALHQIVGGEDENPGYFNARIRILGLCYDLRHANMGHREYEFIDHGIDEDTMKWMGVVGTKKNLYLSFKTYYPEILFITMALNDFIELYEQKNTKHHEWDITITTVRQFQSTIIQSISKTVSPHTFNMMTRNMNAYRVSFYHFFDQYIDKLNIKFLRWDKEKRQKNISIMAKRIAEQGTEYQNLKQDILEVAMENNCEENEIRYYEEYPDYDAIDW